MARVQAQQRLKRDEGATRGLAGFQIAVRLGNVGQGIRLIDVNQHPAAGHGFKQIIGHRLRAFARDDVAEQGLTCEVNRPLRAQDARGDRCRRT